MSPLLRKLNRPVLAVLAVGLIAGTLRFTHLGYPQQRIFDEYYYSKSACIYLGYSNDRCDVNSSDERYWRENRNDTGAWVHPPLGKWMIAVGELAVGTDSYGWRVSSAVIGTATVMLLAVIVQLLFGSAALDLRRAGCSSPSRASTSSSPGRRCSTSSSRSGSSLGLRLPPAGPPLDRAPDARPPTSGGRAARSAPDAGASREPSGRGHPRAPAEIGTAGPARPRRPRRSGARGGSRPGSRSGPALATKWSAAHGDRRRVVLLSLLWEVTRRRRFGVRAPDPRGAPAEGFGSSSRFVVVPALVYLALVRAGGSRTSAGASRVGATCRRRSSSYHRHLQTVDPPASRSIRTCPRHGSGSCSTGRSCTTPNYGDGVRQVIYANGNPAIFWGGLLAIPYVASRVGRRRDWRAGFVVDRDRRAVPAVVPRLADRSSCSTRRRSRRSSSSRACTRCGTCPRSATRPCGRRRIAPAPSARTCPSRSAFVVRRGRAVRLVLAGADRRPALGRGLVAAAPGSLAGPDPRSARRDASRPGAADRIPADAPTRTSSSRWPTACAWRRRCSSRTATGRGPRCSRPSPTARTTSPHRGYREEYERLAAEFGYAVCRLDIRGTGLLGGARDRRVHAPRSSTDLAEVIAWLASLELVQRQRRDVRDVVVGVQLAPGRDAPAAGAEGDLLDLRVRRPVRRRRPLLRRRAEAARPRRLADLHGARATCSRPSPASTARGGASSWERRMRGRTSRGCSTGSSTRRTTTTGSTARSARTTRRSRRRRCSYRLGRRLHEHRAPRVRRAAVPEAAARRPVVARVASRRSPARAEHRPRARDGPVVGPVAEGRRQRGRPRPADRRCSSAGPTPPAADLAGTAASGASSPAGRSSAGARRRSSSPTRPRTPPVTGPDELDGPRRRRLDGVDQLRRRAAVGTAARPATRRGVLASSTTGSRSIDELEVLGHPRVGCASRPRRRSRTCRPSSATSIPDGTSQLVTRGLLNLTHRESREHPSPLEPGRPVDVTIELEVTSWVFEPGHRIRLDLAGSDWPNAWPPPLPVHAHGRARPGSPLVLPTLDGPVAGRARARAPAAEAGAGRAAQPAGAERTT